jgi:hypothetical protein
MSAPLMIFPSREWLLVRSALAFSLTFSPSLFDLRVLIECLLIFIALQYSLYGAHDRWSEARM